MERKFGKDDVLRFIYGELPEECHEDFLSALCTDEELYNTFEELQEAHDGLEVVDLEPSEHSVGKVLQFARESCRERTGGKLLPHKGRFALTHAVSLLMVILSVVTIALGVYGLKAADNDSPALSTESLQLEVPMLQRKLDMMRREIHHIRNNKEAILPVYHNTYRLVNTSEFAPTDKNIVFLNIK